MSASLLGRNVVVTGVTSGIGRALVLRLLDEGAQVLGLGRDSARLDELARDHRERFVPVVSDLAVPSDRERAVARIRRSFDRIDAIVNNAAECVFETPLSLSLERWRRLLEVDFVAAVELVKELADRLPATGHVVTVSSVTTQFIAHPAFAPYALVKTALESFTDALRLELAPRGVAVTTVRPGLVATPLYEKVDGFDKMRARISETVPEWLSAEDVADAIVWTLARPHPVVVSELTLLPRRQAR